MPQSYACLHYHFVFSTKNRAPLLSGELRPRLFEYVGGILRADGGCLIGAGGVADHVHLLAGLSREMAVADALRLVKTNSSKWLHETGLADPSSAWQTGYGAFTVSHSRIDVLRRYFARQEEHHRTQSFQDEFRELLRLHHVEFDERYLWD